MIPLSMLVQNYKHNFFPSIYQELSFEKEEKSKLLKVFERKKKILNFIKEIYLMNSEESKFDFTYLKVILEFEKKNIIKQIPLLRDETYIDFFLNTFIPFCNKIIDISNLESEEIFLYGAKNIDLNTFHFFFEFFIEKLFKDLEKKTNHFEINEVKQFLNNFSEKEHIDGLLKKLVCEEKPMMDDDFKIQVSENSKKERWEIFKNLVYESDIIKNVRINEKFKKNKNYYFIRK